MNSHEREADRGAFSVIIPAHDEAAVIALTLRALLDSSDDAFARNVLVVCNGCSDNTAEVARAAAPQAEIIELEQGSKALALNTGLARARTFPVVFLDADTRISRAGLAAVADAVREPGVMVASPAADIDTDECDPWVQAYYRLWRRHPYLQEGVGGSGVVALSREAADTLGQFPKVMADDGLLRSLFPLRQQRRISADASGRPVAARIMAPKRIGNLIACESRWRSGDAELNAIDLPAAQEDPAAGRTGAIQLWKISGSTADWLVYCGIKAVGRAIYWFNRRSGRSGLWHRDSSRRELQSKD